jgi:hypothetical protein
MFKCGLTGKKSITGEKPVRVVTHIRERIYENDSGFVSRGWEIAKEVLAKPDAAKNAPPPEIVKLDGQQLAKLAMSKLSRLSRDEDDDDRRGDRDDRRGDRDRRG